MTVSLFLLFLQVLVTLAVQGIVIGLLLAFPILTVATHNVIIGFMATLTISLIALSVYSMIEILGWKLGVQITSLILRLLSIRMTRA